VILGVSFDTPAQNRAFAEKFHFNLKVCSESKDNRKLVA
jgi:peroxiredoxin